MDVVVLNGARNGDAKVDEVSNVLVTELKEIANVSVFRLREIPVADCVGCFGCWIKTPGQCVIDDAARDIALKLPNSDLTVYVTPVVFGGYSYELKKILDRQISAILPFFKKVHGELHHPPRYEKTGKLAAIGVLPGPNPQSEEIFKTLLYRNSLNKQATHHSTAIIYATDDHAKVVEKIAQMLSEVEVKV